MRRFVTLAILCVLPILPAAAQYALDVDALVGFSGVFRAGTWTPVHVTIQNLGQPVRGELLVEIERGDRFGPNRYAVQYSRPLELVSGGSKAFSFVVPLDTTVYPITVRITDGGEVAHEEEYDLLGRSVPARLAVVLSRRPNLDFLLPLYNSADSRVLDVVYPLPNYLPDQWQGYEAADVIVVHDARLQELTTDQVMALKGWVASGGRLVVSGGAHFGPADAQTLAPLGNFATDGIATTRVEDAGFLENGLPIDPGERNAEVVATSFIEYGTQITRLPIGRGDIVVLPVDYANLVRVAPLTSVALWNALLGSRADEDAIATELRRRVFETDVLANQLTLPLYDFPSRLLVLGLAVSYTVGLASILVWLARGRDALRAWLGAPAIATIVIAVALTGHVALTVSLQPVEALELSVERAELLADGGYALVTRETALFSRQRAEYELRYPDTPLLVPMAERDHRVTMRADGASQRLTIGRWGYENNLAVQIVPFELHVRVQSGPGYAEIELTNGTPRPITDVVVLTNGFPSYIGDLRPGDVVEHIAGAPNGRDFQAIEWNTYVAEDELGENRARLVGDIARAQRFDAESSPDVIVVGWTSAPLLPVEVDPGFARTVDLHVVSVPIYVEERTE